MLHRAGLSRKDLAYIATTGEGETLSFRTGHFYGMTTHARGGLFLEPQARASLREAAAAAGLLKAVSDTSGIALPAELGKLVAGLGWSEIERIGGIAKDDIDGAANAMLGAAKVVTFVSNIFGRIGAPGLTTLFAEAVSRSCPGPPR